MRTEQEVRTFIDSSELIVQREIAKGAPTYPSTVLERHAYQMGQLAALKWVCPKPAEEAAVVEKVACSES